MKRRIQPFVFVLMALLISNASWARNIDEGIEYKRLTSPVPTQSKDKIEVVELFWYGCPHCFQFEPDIHDWVKNKPANVEFIRIPAIFGNPSWVVHAKAYYTAEFLGVLGKIHKPLFDAMHLKKQNLNSARAVRAFFIKQGVSAEDFDNVFNSFAVDSKVRRAKELSRRYGINGVPSLVVNGTYVTDGPMAGGRRGMLNVLNYLVEKASATR